MFKATKSAIRAEHFHTVPQDRKIRWRVGKIRLLLNVKLLQSFLALKKIFAIFILENRSWRVDWRFEGVALICGTADRGTAEPAEP